MSIVNTLSTASDLDCGTRLQLDRKSTRLNSSHMSISYAVFCLKKKNRIPASRTILIPLAATAPLLVCPRPHAHADPTIARDRFAPFDIFIASLPTDVSLSQLLV